MIFYFKKECPQGEFWDTIKRAVCRLLRGDFYEEIDVTTAETIPPSSSGATPPASPSNLFSFSWLSFFFGVLVGYVVFRPGGVIDYFLLSGGMRDRFAQEDARFGGQRGGWSGAGSEYGREFGPGAGGEREGLGFDGPPGGRYQGGGDPYDNRRGFGEDGFSDQENGPLRAPRAPGSVQLPPTDLFSGR